MGGGMDNLGRKKCKRECKDVTEKIYNVLGEKGERKC